MAERTSITTDAGGRRVVAKLAGNAEESERLAREAATLDAARHPGVVELVGVDGHGVGAILLTAHADGPTLAQVGQLPLEEAAGVLAALATTVADLHELNLVHGALCPDHVILGPGGRPVLCSLGYGGRVGNVAAAPPALGRAFTDPRRDGATTVDPAVDVFGLGALARFLAPNPAPGHVLARMAAEATEPEPASRPTARAVAAAVQQEVPAARLPRALLAGPPPVPTVPRRVDPLDAWRRGGGGRRPLGGGGRLATGRRGLVLVGLAVAAMVGGAAVVSGQARGRAPALTKQRAEPAVDATTLPPADDAVPGPSTTRAGPASTTSTPPTVAAVRRDCPPVNTLLQADVDGDGCPDALRYADGILDAGSVRWAVGRAGDQVATGDWGCQGTTVALFRPSTGEVFRFDGWAGADSDLTATAIGVVPGGQALRAADVDRDGCHEIVVERGAGPAEVIRVPGAKP